MAVTTKMTMTGEGGGDVEDGDGGDITGGRKRRGRMKGGATITKALSNVDVGRDERAKGGGPA